MTSSGSAKSSGSKGAAVSEQVPPPLTLSQTDTHDWTGARDRIIHLFAQRQSITFIAKAVGLSVTTVRKILQSEFNERNKNRQDVVEAHRQTLDWVIKKVTQRLESAGPLWDRRDAELLLKYLDREAKCFGIDEPTKHEVTVVEELSQEELVSQLKASGFALQLTQPSQPPLQLPLPPPQIEDAEYARAEDRHDAGEEASPEDTCGE
jgi:hypothetical protein